MSEYILLNRPVEKAIPRNEPAPYFNPEIQRELTRIGGIVPSVGGPHAGKPIYQIVWGMQHRWFERGKMRLMFVNEEILPMVVQERFYIAPEVFSAVAEWQRNRDKAILSRVWDKDYSAFADILPMSAFLKANISPLQYLELQKVTAPRDEVWSDVESIASISAPADWKYIADIAEIIEIGKPLFYILRWVSPHSHGGRASWERLRWVTNAYIPEINETVPMVDNTGPFPECGVYIPRFEIADYYDENGELLEFAKTAAPTWQTAIEPVRQEIYEEAQVKHSQLANQQRNVDRHRAGYEAKIDDVIAVNKKVSERIGVEPTMTKEQFLN